MEDKTRFIARIKLILGRHTIKPSVVYGERVMENLLEFGFIDNERYGFSDRRLFLQLCMLVACNLNEKLIGGDKNLKKGKYPMKGVFSSFRISDEDIMRHWGISKVVVVVDPEIPAVIEVRRRNSRDTSVGIQLGNFKRYLKRVQCEKEYYLGLEQIERQSIFSPCLLEEVEET